MRVPVRLVVVVSAAILFSACHYAHAADPPKPMSPSLDVEVEDRAADKSMHTARFSLGIVNGRADLRSSDGDTRYALETHTNGSDGATYALSLKRSDPHGAAGDIDLGSAIPQRGPRVLVARIERADGRVTSVTAQVH